MQKLLAQIRQCTLCEQNLPFEPKPILQASADSKILIVGQAPGVKAHKKAMPFDDLSGDRLRNWLGVDKAQFYQANNFAIVPMGFCYPGRGKSGDLPPLPLCAATWREALLAKLTKVELTILLGRYAINWHLHSSAPITELAQQWQSLLQSKQLVLPHPSPRNNIWLKRNDWFETAVIPVLQTKVNNILTASAHRP